MQNILIVFFIISFVIMILCFPFKIRAMGHFNLLDLIGFYSFKIMKFRLLNGKIWLENGKIVVQNTVNVLKDKFSDEFSKILIKELIARIDAKKIEIFFSGGISNNSFSSAIMCGSVSSITQSLYSYLSQKYYNVKLYEDIDARFGQDNLEITFDFVISISFLSIIISMINAIRLNLEGEKKWEMILQIIR